MADSKIVYEWSKATHSPMFKADAQKVGEEIYSICEDFEQATPQQILEKGRDEKTELHKCFEWDDSIAAEKFRLDQARGITRSLVFYRNEQQKENDEPEIRVFHKTEQTRDSGYKPLTVIVANQDEYKKLLQRAWLELHAFKEKYKNLKELDYILSLIP